MTAGTAEVPPAPLVPALLPPEPGAPPMVSAPPAPPVPASLAPVMVKVSSWNRTLSSLLWAPVLHWRPTLRTSAKFSMFEMSQVSVTQSFPRLAMLAG